MYRLKKKHKIKYKDMIIIKRTNTLNMSDLPSGEEKDIIMSLFEDHDFPSIYQYEVGDHSASLWENQENQDDDDEEDFNYYIEPKSPLDLWFESQGLTYRDEIYIIL